jgi:hypothetical protein
VTADAAMPVPWGWKFTVTPLTELPSTETVPVAVRFWATSGILTDT